MLEMRQSTDYYCSDSSLHGCTNERIGRITHFSVYILFVCAVGAVLLPTVTSSMPEKSGFAIVEKYGDCAKAVRRFLPGRMKNYVATLPPAIEEVVLRALAKEPKERFASVQDFATALQHADQGTTSPPSTLLSTLAPTGEPTSPSLTTLTKDISLRLH